MSKSTLSANGKATGDVSLEDLSIQIEILKSDLSSLTHTLGELGSAKTAAAKESVQKSAADLQAASREKMLEAQTRAEDFVQTQPATAIGLAAGLGFLVGMLTARRN